MFTNESGGDELDADGYTSTDRPLGSGVVFAPLWIGQRLKA